jgi:hypothetical protein
VAAPVVRLYSQTTIIAAAAGTYAPSRVASPYVYPVIVARIHASRLRPDLRRPAALPAKPAAMECAVLPAKRTAAGLASTCKPTRIIAVRAAGRARLARRVSPVSAAARQAKSTAAGRVLISKRTRTVAVCMETFAQLVWRAWAANAAAKPETPSVGRTALTRKQITRIAADAGRCARRTKRASQENVFFNVVRLRVPKAVVSIPKRNVFMTTPARRCCAAISQRAVAIAGCLDVGEDCGLAHETNRCAARESIPEGVQRVLALDLSDVSTSCAPIPSRSERNVHARSVTCDRSTVAVDGTCSALPSNSRAERRCPTGMSECLETQLLSPRRRVRTVRTRRGQGRSTPALSHVWGKPGVPAANQPKARGRKPPL